MGAVQTSFDCSDLENPMGDSESYMFAKKFSSFSYSGLVSSGENRGRILFHRLTNHKDKANWTTNLNKLRCRITILTTIMFLPLVITGCGTLPNGRGWGQDAIWPVDMKRITRAAHNAFFDLNTLIPLAGAGVFYAVNDFDEKVSHWATKHHPIFGSEESAKDASRSLKTVLQIETIITSIATPSGDDPQNWTYSKLKGIGVELAARKVTLSATTVLKHATDRTRPNSSSDTSFPSGCTSGAFSSATLTNRNIDYIDIDSTWLPNELRRGVQFGNLCLASGVAWARVEGRAHYPSDVLAGAALGHFLSAFIYDAFLGLPENERFGFSIAPFEGGAIAKLSFYF